jgi:TolB-like protein/Flp pilus assembly protein TadD
MGASYKFGPFCLDVEAEVLFRGAEPVALGRRAVGLLQVLVRQPGALVAKDALIDAAWPGQAVEESNLTVQIGALRRVLEEVPGGVHRIDTLPRRGYRFMGPVTKEESGGSAAPLAEVEPALALPDKPSIAVLPFKNISGDPEQDYFADGIVDEIITALSRMRWLFVIASNSSFTYKDRAVDVRQVSRELGVRYVLEGSVRKAANRVRIIGQLIDATRGTHIWADRFDGALEDIFDLQDQVTASVVGAIAPKLEQAEIERARRKPTENLDAYDYFLRGMAKVYQWTKEANDEALALFYKAIELDPDFPSAYGQATLCYAWRKASGCVIDREQEIRETARLARRAVELGKDDAFPLCCAGYSLGLVVGEGEDGAAYMDRALALNPNLPRAWHLSGWVRIFVSKPNLAIEHVARAMRLSPRDPNLFDMLTMTAYAHFYLGRDDEALSWAERAVREQPNWYPAIRVLAASSALLGQAEKAQKAMSRLQQVDPTRRISNLVEVLGPYRPKDFARLADGLRKAGMPE